jgi:hypothetical protein
MDEIKIIICMRGRTNKSHASMTNELASIAKIMCVPRANDTKINGQLEQDVDTEVAKTSVLSGR